MMAMHPHGIIGVSAWSAFLNDHEGSYASIQPDMDVRFVTLASNFKIPFFRELLLWVGLLDASADTIRFNLNKGRSIIVMVGGAEESLHARPGVSELVLSRRKGFVKIALQMGTPLVPVYGFGENELFYQVSNPEGSILRRVQEYIKGITGVALPAFHGRGIFLYDYGFLPRRIPLVTVIGEPIPLPKIEKPTDEDIEKYHTIYIENLKRLYNEYKGSDDLKIL
jgi:2-acylglycerol O-acyltransferase 2